MHIRWTVDGHIRTTWQIRLNECSTVSGSVIGGGGETRSEITLRILVVVII